MDFFKRVDIWLMFFYLFYFYLFLFIRLYPPPHTHTHSKKKLIHFDSQAFHVMLRLAGH